jgi:starch-binding outer membrane protein, SusD/RagB family
MSGNRHIIPTIILAVVVFLSCSKTLEKEPLNQLTNEFAWDPQDSLGIYPRNFLHNLYTYLPTGFNRIDGNLLDAASDDAVPSEPGTDIARMTNGGYSSVSNPDDAWQKNYYGIRKANLFLKNFPVVPMKDATTRKYWTAEARFLRAMFYYELVKRYGGVPLLGDTVLTLQDDLRFARNTFDECVDYIVAECDAVKDSLRTDPLSDADWGRISQGVAMMLKAKVLLLAASPLNDPTQNLNKWKLAADASKAIMTSNKFILEASFTNVFTTRKNKEVILAFQRAVTTDVEVNNAPVGYQSGQTFSQGRTSPTQELVDAFPMKNGKAITDATSGYKATDPYKDRDPRFYATVFHNGMRWLGRNVETFEGGRDNPGGPLVETQTGYYMRKFMANFDNATAYSNQTHNFVIFRYAEVLLNFAEAQNEFGGPNAEVYKAVEDIRKRAGLVPFALKIGMTQAEMREAIRQERRTEMAFEEQRFWDIRRWKIAENVYNKPLHGMRITNTNGVLNYEVFELRTPFLFSAPKMYRYPIPYSEVVKNSNLQQNEGWD